MSLNVVEGLHQTQNTSHFQDSTPHKTQKLRFLFFPVLGLEPMTSPKLSKFYHRVTTLRLED